MAEKYPYDDTTRFIFLVNRYSAAIYRLKKKAP